MSGFASAKASVACRRECIPQRFPVRNQFPDIPDAVSADVETVHHHGPDTAFRNEGECFGNAGSIDLGDDQHGGADARMARSAQRIHRLLPGTGKAGEVIMDGSIGAEERNLDDADAQAQEVLQGIVGQEGPVAEHIDLAALESRMKYQVMDIGEQHRFASGEGKTAHRGLRKQLFQGFPGSGRVRWRNGRTAVTPIVITKPATLVAGPGQFVDEMVNPHYS